MKHLLRDEVWEKAKKTTMGFEGTGYDNISGNFDSMGLSLGFLQWNLGQGTLQPLFIKLLNEYPTIAESTLDEGVDIIKEAISKGTLLPYAIQNMNSSGNRIIEPWYGRFAKLCNTPEFKAVQDSFAQPYKERAISMCEMFEVYTDRAFCLLFDIAVQNGSVINPPDLSGMDTIEKMQSLINSVVDQCNSKWQDDVRARKETILKGSGIVHGTQFSLDFDDTIAFETKIDEDIEMLKNNGLINSPEYWIQNSKPGCNIDGEYAAKLIMNIASQLNQAKMLSGALEVLSERGIVLSSDYWQQQAVKEGLVAGEYVAELIHKATKNLS